MSSMNIPDKTLEGVAQLSGRLVRLGQVLVHSSAAVTCPVTQLNFTQPCQIVARFIPACFLSEYIVA